MEGLADVALRVGGKYGGGSSPSRRVRITTGDVIWNGISGKEPNVDGILLPSMSVDTSAISVEALSVGLRIINGKGTSRVVPVAALACGPNKTPSGVRRFIDVALVTGVGGNLVGRLSIYAL